MSKLELVPLRQREARAFVREHHRHHMPPCGGLYAIGAMRDEQLVGAAIVGLPVARALCDGYTAEVTRLCTLDGETARHAASKLYAAAWRAWRAMGGRRLISYTLADESGVSLVAAGWRAVYRTRGHSWNSPSRPRVDKHPLCDKTLWEMVLLTDTASDTASNGAEKR